MQPEARTPKRAQTTMNKNEDHTNKEYVRHSNIPTEGRTGRTNPTKTNQREEMKRMKDVDMTTTDQKVNKHVRKVKNQMRRSS